MDRDGNGFTTGAELTQLFASSGEEITDNEVDEEIHQADLNGDGQISQGEYVAKKLTEEEGEFGDGQCESEREGRGSP